MAFKSFDRWLSEDCKPIAAKKRLRVLTQEGERLEWDYKQSNGCSCHLGGAPCSHCCHPGSPDALDATPELWEEIEVDDDDS